MAWTVGERMALGRIYLMKTRGDFGSPLGKTAQEMEELENGDFHLPLAFRTRLAYSWPELNISWINDGIGGGPLRRDYRKGDRPFFW